jgi:dTDP-4-dehydrorhamnose 3,5-epimerase
VFRIPFLFKRLEIPDVILVTPKSFEDDRGFFMESFKSSEFKKNGISYDFVQDNHSKSQKGVLRGLHYQLNPKAQGKLVRVVSGSMFDVAVDIRKGSPYYGKYISVILSAENKNMLWIPPGFAHGTYFMEDDTELLYKATDEYSPEHDRSMIWNDPAIDIKWPVTNPLLSEKDLKAKLLKDADNNFIYEVKK